MKRKTFAATTALVLSVLAVNSAFAARIQGPDGLGDFGLGGLADFLTQPIEGQQVGQDDPSVSAETLPSGAGRTTPDMTSGTVPAETPAPPETAPAEPPVPAEPAPVETSAPPEPAPVETTAPAEPSVPAETTTQETMEAQETDPYGNPIEWDPNASGGEDGAGMETGADLMDSPTYSPEEQESVSAAVGTHPAENEETGCVRVVCNLGNDWAGYNVCVSIYDADFDRYRIYCYQQNNYEALEELPAGHYQVYEAAVPGDKTNAYPLALNVTDFELEPNSTYEITVSRIENAGHGSLTDPGAPDITEAPSESPRGPRSILDDLMSMLQVILIVAVCGLAGFGIVYFIRNRKGNRYQ